MSGIRTRIVRGVSVCTLWVYLVPPVVALEIPAQREVARLTMAAVPEPLDAFYAERLDAVIERTIEPDGAWTRESHTRGREDWHYLMLDASAPALERDARMEAARAFPSKQRDARRLFRKQNVKHGGELPWRLDALVEDLRQAFVDGDEDRIIQYSGYVIHFAVDASNPFNTTRDRDASAAGNIVFGNVAFGDALYAHQNAAQRVGWELIRRNAERYRSRIDTSTLRFELAIDDLPYTTIEWMGDSLNRLDDLLAADRDAMSRIGATDGDTFLARSDEYYQLLDASCGDICVENLRRATRLATTLIVTAWTRAESPTPGERQLVQADVPIPPSGITPSDRSAPTAKAEAPNVVITYVASRNSKIFHRSDCTHAARISEKNLVQYATLREALASGKRPCLTCHPDESDTAATN